MTVASSPHYAENFRRLLQDEGLLGGLAFNDARGVEELPLFSRTSQLGFLDALPVAERNRQLIRAAVSHLDLVTSSFGGSPTAENSRYLRMVSIVGWWVDDEAGTGACTDGATQVVIPYFWVGDLQDEVMREFRLYPAISPCAKFVNDTVHCALFSVLEDEVNESNGYCPEHVYVMPSSQVSSVLIKNR